MNSKLNAVLTIFYDVKVSGKFSNILFIYFVNTNIF